MAKVKYDVSGDIPETGNAPVGVYRAKIKSAEEKTSKSDNLMVVVTFELTHHADGKKVKEDYWPVRQYLMIEDDRPYALRTIKEFMAAVGMKTKGVLDTDKIAGKQVQVKLKSDTDQDGEYQPRIGKIMPLAEVEDDEPDEDEDEDVPEDEDDEGTEDEDEEEDDEEDEDEEEGDEEVDLSELSRSELKALIAEQELDIKVLKKHSDDDIRAAIEAALGSDDEDEEDDEEEDDEDEAADYTSMSIADLKAELKERELPVNGAKAVLIKRLQKDDGGDSF